MKKFANNKENIVEEALLGLTTNPSLSLIDSFPTVKVVLRSDWDKKNVSVISGGGSGHEPAHAGFVGKGLLTAAVCGDIFASPAVDAVLNAIVATTGEKGCLLIVKNYTGDRLNFGLAAEQARALGYKVEMVIVGDDVSLGLEGQRRGLAGTIFFHKIAGYLSEKGKSLNHIHKILNSISDKVFTVGLSLTDSETFGGKSEKRLKDDEAEIGLGIHGEKGKDIIPFKTADELMTSVTDLIQMHIKKKSLNKYVVLINNLGGTSPIEMQLLVNSYAQTSLAKKTKYIIGPSHYMTSIDMHGFSVSILIVENDTIWKALKSECDPSAWTGVVKFGTFKKTKAPKFPKIIEYKPSANASTRKIIESIANMLIDIEDELNELDKEVGDGDAGSTFAKGAKTILSKLDKLPFAHLDQLFITLGKLFSHEIGGSGGVLWSILLIATANELEKQKNLADSLAIGLQKMQELGGAQVGDRTQIDALAPGIEALQNDEKDISTAAKAARKGAEKTKQITKTKFGRSSYLSESALKGKVDPGAEVIARVFENIENIIKNKLDS